VTKGRAAVIGIGMIGGSLAAALRAQGWWVSGSDVDTDRVNEAKVRGIIDEIDAPTVDVTFVASPVSLVVDLATAALERGGIVTDVGSVKRSIVDSIKAPRFVGGHPMAGSERSGLDGVDPDLFQGATWVLTPGDTTDTDAYLVVRDIVASLGADIVTLDAQQHDEMVATISHVPHFTATALMSLALARSDEHEAVLRLAAGGFRDMTRIAAGHPGLWADIALQNQNAIVDGLGRLASELDDLRELIAKADRGALEAFLAVAAEARKELPLRSGRPPQLAVLHIPIPDRPGSLGDVLGLFGRLRVNVEDLEIAHDPKGDRGTLQVTIDATAVVAVREALLADGFRSSMETL
jgi:prephenate dehydrogenase